VKALRVVAVVAALSLVAAGCGERKKASGSSVHEDGNVRRDRS